MNVDLGHFDITRHEHRSAKCRQLPAHGRQIQRPAVGRDQEHRLVAPAVGVAVLGGWREHLGPRQAASRHGLTGHRRESTFQEPVQPLPAGVDHAGLTQDRQQCRGASHGPVRRVDRGGKDGLQAGIRLGGLGGRFSRLPDDREDGAFHGRGDGGIGRLAAAPQAMRQVPAGYGSAFLADLRHAPQDLREDDATVAARAHQRSEADRGGHARQGALSDRDRVRLLER